METETPKDRQAVADFIMSLMPTCTNILVYIEEEEFLNHPKSNPEDPVDFVVWVDIYELTSEIVVTVKRPHNLELDFCFESWDDLEKNFPNLTKMSRMERDYDDDM